MSQAQADPVSDFMTLCRCNHGVENCLHSDVIEENRAEVRQAAAQIQKINQS